VNTSGDHPHPANLELMKDLEEGEILGLFLDGKGPRAEGTSTTDLSHSQTNQEDWKTSKKRGKQKKGKCGCGYQTKKT
jgi:hypothetical protein